MAFEGEAGDEFGFQPPPPEERSWRHPSELGGTSKRTASGRGGGAARPISLVTSEPPPPRGTSSRTVLVAVIAGLVGSIVTLAAVVVLGGFQKQAPGPADVQRYDVTDQGKGTQSPVEIAEKVVPSVARLDVVRQGTSIAGTAVVFRSNAQSGYLITTADLVDGADTIAVTIGDGQSHPAQFIGRDLESDIAVVKVDLPNLPTVVLGRPASKLQLGNPVIAVESSPTSSPTRGANNVPLGLINGLGERLASDNPGVKTLYGMIKTNLRLTSEATGAPLIDATNASVIGIITSRGYRAPMAATPGTAGQGQPPSSLQSINAKTASGSSGTVADEVSIRFATPIDYANSVADQLIKYNRVPYAWLGVNGDSLSDDDAKRLGIKAGYRISNIEPSSPADEAQLHIDDVLLTMDERPITTLDELRVELRQHRPGDTVTIYYMRNGERQPAYVALKERLPGG